jgi:hypothetical protein
MAATADPQHGLFDREVEDGDLVSALEKRETLNTKRKDATAAYKEQHEKVKALLDAYELGDEEIVRIGRFLIKNSRSEGRSVSFETSPSVRTRISLLGDDA